LTSQTETSKNLAFILFHKITKAWHIVLNLSCYLEWSASTKITRLLLFLATFIFCLVIKRGKKQFIFIYYFEGSNSYNLFENNNTQMRRSDVGFKVQFCSCSLPALNWWQIEAIRLIRTWKKSEHSPARLHLSKNSTWVIIKIKKKRCWTVNSAVPCEWFEKSDHYFNWVYDWDSWQNPLPSAWIHNQIKS
jgi:hypothetical protein